MGLAMAMTGKGTQALTVAEEAREIIAVLSEVNPTNAEYRGLLASSYSVVGYIHATLAARERQPSRQADHWRAARDGYQHSYEILKAQKDRGEFASVEYGGPEEEAAKIAECDAALARLSGK